jgi:hypothetical protein
MLPDFPEKGLENQVQGYFPRFATREALFSLRRLSSSSYLLLNEFTFLGKDYKEAPRVSQVKRNPNMYGVVGQSALMITGAQ